MLALTTVCLMYVFVLVGGPGIVNVWMEASKVIELRHNSTSNESNHAIRVCMGADWYTFPSHFFLPSSARLEFVDAGFKGQLPQLYASIQGTHSAPRGPFNDENREESSRYIPFLECDYAVTLMHNRTLHTSVNHFEEFLQKKQSGFEIVYAKDIIDAAHSPILTRAFHLPYYSSNMNRHSTYTLFRRKSTNL